MDFNRSTRERGRRRGREFGEPVDAGALVENDAFRHRRASSLRDPKEIYARRQPRSLLETYAMVPRPKRADAPARNSAPGDVDDFENRRIGSRQVQPHLETPIATSQADRLYCEAQLRRCGEA